MADDVEKTRKWMFRTLNLYRLAVLGAPIALLSWYYLSSTASVNSISFYSIMVCYLFYLNPSFLEISSETILESDKPKEIVKKRFKSSENPIFALFEPQEEMIRGRTVIKYSGKNIVFEEEAEDRIKFSQEHDITSSYKVSFEETEEGTRIKVSNLASSYSLNKLAAQVLKSRYVFSAIQKQDYDFVSGHENLSVVHPKDWELDFTPLDF